MPNLDQFLTDAEAFGAVVTAGGDWSGASPCDGWSAADVLDHVIGTERDYLGKVGADLGPEPTGAPVERWNAHLTALRPVLTEELAATPFDGFFGPTTIGAVLEDFYGFDLLVHRWDLGTALGHEITLTDEELTRLESHLPEPGTPMWAAFYSDGICKPPVPVAADATRQAALLAKLGRVS